MFKPTSILFTQKTTLKNSTINIDTNNTLNTSIKKGDTDHLSKYKSYLKTISAQLNNSVNKNTGKVLSIKDGVAFVSGLSSVKMGEMVEFTRIKLMLYCNYSLNNMTTRIILTLIIYSCLSLLFLKTLNAHCMEMGMAGIPGPGGQGDDPNDRFNFPGNGHQSYHYQPKLPGTRQGEEVNLQPILDRISRGDVTATQRYRINFIVQYVLNHNGDLPPEVGVVPSNINREHGEQPSGTRGFIVLIGVVVMGIVLYYNADHVRQYIWQALPSIMQPPLTQGVTEVAQQFPDRLPDFAAAIWAVMREQDPSL